MTDGLGTSSVALHVDDRMRPHPAVLNVAHRGASCSAPENTLAAARRAAYLGADLIEVDVRLSRDGVPVLLHDESLTRTTDARSVYPRRAPWHVADFTYSELAGLDAGSWFSPAFLGEPVPTLAEVMEVASLWGLGLLVELKSPLAHEGTLSQVAAVVRRQLARTPGARVVVQSFDHVAMQTFKSTLPSVPVGLLGAPPTMDLTALSAWADQINPHHLSMGPAYVEAVHRAGMRCHVWTVDRRPAMRRALRLGVDGVITNRPEVLGELLTRTGARARPAVPGRPRPASSSPAVAAPSPSGAGRAGSAGHRSGPSTPGP